MTAVYENIVEWKRPDGLRVRAWLKRNKVGPRPGIVRVLLDAMMQNDIEPGRLEAGTDLMEPAMFITQFLEEKYGTEVNALEVTFNGQGVVYYPSWP